MHLTSNPRASSLLSAAPATQFPAKITRNEAIFATQTHTTPNGSIYLYAILLFFVCQILADQIGIPLYAPEPCLKMEPTRPFAERNFILMQHHS